MSLYRIGSNLIRSAGAILQTPSGGGYLRDPQVGDLFLDTTAGSDGSGTQASPWNNLTAARLNMLSAGQALWVRNGSSFQLPNTQTTQLPSGNSSNPIIFAGYPGETATVTMPIGGVPFGGGDWWTIGRLTVSCVDNGFVLGNSSGSGNTTPTNHWVFYNILGTRSDSAGATTDNSGIIKADDNNDFLTILGGNWSGPSKVNNQACIWIDRVPNIQIIGALVVGSASPIYFKHNPAGTPTGLVKWCIIRNAGRSFQAQRSFVQYIGNVLDTTELSLDASGGGALASGCVLDHNTFYNSNITNNQGATTTNMTLTNNVLAGSSLWRDNAFSSFDQGDSIDYSAVDGSGNNHYERNSSLFTLSSYKSTYATQEVHGLAGSVSFLGGASGGGSSASGWGLTPGSFGTAANGQGGSDGVDRGVDATKLLSTA